MQKFFSKLHISSFLKITVCVLVFLVTHITHAASLYLNPSSLQLNIGETAKVRVQVNTKGISVNAVEGLIKYDSSIIDVTSVSKLNSILNIWIEEPTISNSGGTISFNGGAINPGYTGSAGEVFSFTVKAKKTGSAQLTFTDATVRASDGEGTDVLTTEAGATITINNKASQSPVVPPETTKTTTKTVVEPVKKPIYISAPELVSSTHPDQTAWYSNRSADISWTKNANASGVQVVFNSSPNTIASGPIQYKVTTKGLRGVRDGVSYIHVRHVGQNSVSETSHFAIQVDTTSPTDVSIATSTVDGTTMLEIFAKDVHAGIAYADLVLDSGQNEKVEMVDGRLIYKPQEHITTGLHNAQVTVYDKAGNKADLQSEVYLEVPKHEVVVPVVEPTPVKEVSESKQYLTKIGTWVRNNHVMILMSLGVILLLILLGSLISCLKKRKAKARGIECLESGYNQSVANLKQEAYNQVIYLERIAELRSLTQAEKDMYKKCRSILS